MRKKWMDEGGKKESPLGLFEFKHMSDVVRVTEGMNCQETLVSECY